MFGMMPGLPSHIVEQKWTPDPGQCVKWISLSILWNKEIE